MLFRSAWITRRTGLREVPGKGLGFGLLRYQGDAQTQASLAALPQARVTFNYLGQFDQSFNNDGLFVPAQEASGAAQSLDSPLANWLSVDGQVYGGELKLDLSFSQECFDTADIEALASSLKAQLQALIAHCLNPQHSGEA